MDISFRLFLKMQLFPDHAGRRHQPTHQVFAEEPEGEDQLCSPHVRRVRLGPRAYQHFLLWV